MNSERKRIGVFRATAVSTLLCLACWGDGAAASDGEQRSLPDLVRQAAAIVQGDVVKVQSAWTQDRTQIVTTVEITVGRYLKGGPPLFPPDKVVLTILGGTVGNMTLLVMEQPRFALNEEVIVFLPAQPSPYRPTVGHDDGKFQVVTDATTGEKRVGGSDQTLEEFRALVAAVVKTQQVELEAKARKLEQQLGVPVLRLFRPNAGAENKGGQP